MPGKIKGTGGIGQWDTGTANQDIRASTQPSSGPNNLSRTSGPGIGITMETYPPARSNRKKGRDKGRGRKQGRKTR
jgi:hypothetical protein